MGKFLDCVQCSYIVDQHIEGVEEYHIMWSLEAGIENEAYKHYIVTYD